MKRVPFPFHMHPSMLTAAQALFTSGHMTIYSPLFRPTVWTSKKSLTSGVAQWAWPGFTPTSLGETSSSSPVIWFNAARFFLLLQHIWDHYQLITNYN